MRPATTPVSIPGLTNVSALSAGGQSGLALLSTGGVDSWGDNAVGQLGNGTTTDTSAPQPQLTAEEIFHRLDEANEIRSNKLKGYTSTRQYSVYEPNKPPDAALSVSMQFVAPSTKIFKTISQEGVGFIHKLVFNASPVIALRGLITVMVATERESRNARKTTCSHAVWRFHS